MKKQLLWRSSKGSSLPLILWACEVMRCDDCQNRSIIMEVLQITRFGELGASDYNWKDLRIRGQRNIMNGVFFCIFFGHLASIFFFFLFLVEQGFLNLNMHENHLKADCWAQPQRFWFYCCGGGAGECMFLTSFRWCWGCWPSIRLWEVPA